MATTVDKTNIDIIFRGTVGYARARSLVKQFQAYTPSYQVMKQKLEVVILIVFVLPGRYDTPTLCRSI